MDFHLVACFLVSASRLLGLSLDSVPTSNDLSLWTPCLSIWSSSGELRGTHPGSSLFPHLCVLEVESIPPGPVLKPSRKDAGRLKI